MPRTKNLPPNSNVSLDDTVVTNNGLTQTANTSIQEIVDLLGTQLSLQSVDLIYNYSTVSGSNLNEGQISTNNFNAATILASAITNIFLSKTTAFGKEVQEYLETTSAALFHIMFVNFNDPNNFAFGTLVTINQIGSTDNFDIAFTNQVNNGVFQNGNTIGIKLFPPAVDATLSDLEYDGDVPDNYTPTSTSATGHLEGIDDALGALSTSGVDVSLDTTNFNGILSPTETNSQLAFDVIDDIGAGDIPTVTTNFDGILSGSDGEVQTALETIDDITAANIPTNTSGFNGILSGSDTLVQTALDTIDNINASSIATVTTNFNGILSAGDVEVQTALQTIDDITAADIPYAGTIPTNYTPTANDVEGHLEGIDAALLNNLVTSDSGTSGLQFGTSNAPSGYTVLTQDWAWSQVAEQVTFYIALEDISGNLADFFPLRISFNTTTFPTPRLIGTDLTTDQLCIINITSLGLPIKSFIGQLSETGIGITVTTDTSNGYEALLDSDVGVWPVSGSVSVSGTYFTN